MALLHEITTPPSKPFAAARPDGGLQSVFAALDLLECFSEHEELGVSDLARRIGVAKSTAHRLLTTLRARGFAERDQESGRYRLGLRLYELGHLAVSRSDLRNAAFPVLQDLHHRTGATAHIAIADNDDVLYLERVIGRNSLAQWRDIGRRMPFTSTSSGKVLQAFSPRFAEAKGPYRVALEETLRRGYAVSVDETVVGLTSVAAPLLGHDGVARAAISLVGPTPLMIADVHSPARLVQHAARKLSKELCL